MRASAATGSRRTDARLPARERLPARVRRRTFAAGSRRTGGVPAGRGCAERTPYRLNSNMRGLCFGIPPPGNRGRDALFAGGDGLEGESLHLFPASFGPPPSRNRLLGVGDALDDADDELLGGESPVAAVLRVGDVVAAEEVVVLAENVVGERFPVEPRRAAIEERLPPVSYSTSGL